MVRVYLSRWTKRYLQSGPSDRPTGTTNPRWAPESLSPSRRFHPPGESCGRSLIAWPSFNIPPVLVPILWRSSVGYSVLPFWSHPMGTWEKAGWTTSGSLHRSPHSIPFLRVPSPHSRCLMDGAPGVRKRGEGTTTVAPCEKGTQGDVEATRKVVPARILGPPPLPWLWGRGTGKDPEGFWCEDRHPGRASNRKDMSRFPDSPF